MNLKVCMIVTDGFEEIEAVGTYAILRRGGLTVDVYALNGAQATGRFGLTCAQLKPFDTLDAAQYAALILPRRAAIQSVGSPPRRATTH